MRSRPGSARDRTTLVKRPSVSVILTTRNDARYIEETLKSVVIQDYADVEIHVQDCESTDGTIEILKRYGVHWTSEPDAGVPDGFNRGLKVTHGEIVIFLGGDDRMLPGAVTVLVGALVENPHAGFSYGDIEYIDGNSRPYYRLRGRPLDLDGLFWGNHVPTQAVAMRRSALNAIGGYRTEIINADWDLFIRLGARFPAVYVPRVLGRYRVHSGSLTLNNLKKFAWSVCYVADTLLQDPMILGQLKRGPRRARAGSYLIAASLYVGAGEYRFAARVFGMAIRSYPLGLFTKRGAGAILAFILGAKLYYRLRNRGRSDVTNR